MSIEGLSKEQRILRVLRKVLGNIVKDTAPRPGRPNPLQESTIEDIRNLFGLIAERERELADEAGMTAKERPHFSDEPQTAQVLKLHKPTKKPH
ncbi:MAG: segregation and condensation protein A [Pseudomonadota bacterium]|jgi:hypothetical protein